MITLKELLSYLRSDVYIVNIDDVYVFVVSGDPNKLKTILSDDTLNAYVKYIDSYDERRTKVVLDFTF